MKEEFKSLVPGFQIKHFEILEVNLIPISELQNRPTKIKMVTNSLLIKFFGICLGFDVKGEKMIEENNHNKMDALQSKKDQ